MMQLENNNRIDILDCKIRIINNEKYCHIINMYCDSFFMYKIILYLFLNKRAEVFNNGETDFRCFYLSTVINTIKCKLKIFKKKTEKNFSSSY